MSLPLKLISMIKRLPMYRKIVMG